MTQEALTKRIEEYLSAGGLFNPELANHVAVRDLLIECREALREHAMREVQRLGQEIEQEPVADAYTFAEMRFVVCHNCGNKRCPKANDHRNACTNSNEVGQKGSSWEHVKPLAHPEQEPVAYINVEKRRLEFAEPMVWHTPTVVKLERIPLYTHQRTWVDLTDEEIDNINYTSAHMLAREVLAKLKQKNGYAEEKNNA